MVPRSLDLAVRVVMSIIQENPIAEVVVERLVNEKERVNTNSLSNTYFNSDTPTATCYTQV